MQRNQTFWDSVLSWVGDHNDTIFKILLIIIATWLITRFGEMVVQRSIRRMIKAHLYVNQEEEKKREETIIAILHGVIRVIAWPMAATVIISQLGVNVGPLIAGAGVIGLAVGFGAQTLVKDTIAGLFIIAENQYRVGDVVKLDDTAGMVEKISLRKTVLRDLDGIVHHIPNGSVTVASNFTSEQSGINLDVGVGYDTDIDKAIKVINKVGQSIADDPEWQDMIIETPSFLRVDNFGDSSIDLKITGTVAPLKQWDVTGELRKRLKIAFDKNGIEIPFPQRVVHKAPEKTRK